MRFEQTLMNELTPLMDALMEALVGNNYKAWLQELGVQTSGSAAQRSDFNSLHEELQQALSSCSDVSALESVCRSLALGADVRAVAIARARSLLAKLCCERSGGRNAQISQLGNARISHVEYNAFPAL